MLYRDYATQEALDAQYDLRAAVPDFPSYLEFYEQESRKARQELECRPDLRFGPTLAEGLDVFPATREGAPVLVFFHGGYWRSFSKNEFSFVARGPVSSGVATVVVDYALCPKVSVGEIVRQARAAVAWTFRNAEGFGADPERVFVSGHSAGGHLATMSAITDWRGDYGLPADTVKGCFPVSGLFDLRPFPYTFLQPKLQLTWAEILRMSPILNLPQHAPPLLVSYGADETDELRRQSEDFLSAWRDRGLPGGLLPQPGKHHFSVLDGFLDADSPLCSALVGRLNA